MALNVTEANAAITLARHLLKLPRYGTDSIPDEAEACNALELLIANARKRLQAGLTADEVRAAWGARVAILGELEGLYVCYWWSAVGHQPVPISQQTDDWNRGYREATIDIMKELAPILRKLGSAVVDIADFEGV